MNADVLDSAKWEINGVRMMLLKLQETEPEESDIYYVLAESLGNALQKLESLES